jgi:two-component system NarL family sensor kinase
VAPDAAGVADRLQFSLARELIANAARHAQASTVSVEAVTNGESLVLTVDDDGIGFDWALENAVPGHIGLVAAADRARAAGGELKVDSTIGVGTRVSVRLPIDNAISGTPSGARWAPARSRADHVR